MKLDGTEHHHTQNYIVIRYAVTVTHNLQAAAARVPRLRGMFESGSSAAVSKSLYVILPVQHPRLRVDRLAATHRSYLQQPLPIQVQMKMKQEESP